MKQYDDGNVAVLFLKCEALKSSASDHALGHGFSILPENYAVSQNVSSSVL